jgi:hypothetical protein
VAAGWLLSGQPPEARAAPGMELALQDDAVLVNRSYYDRRRALRQARALGVSRVRINVYWRRVMARTRSPVSARYDWRPYDEAVSHALAYGMRVQASLTGPAPRWATGNGRPGTYRPSAALFGDFARRAAEHFRGRIDRYSIWNEPNYSGWLAPRRGAAALYRRLYLAGYAAIKGADPAAQVLIGETAPYGKRSLAIAPLRFLRSLTCADRDYRPRAPCPPLLADGYAHHPYDFRRPVGPPERAYPGGCGPRDCPDGPDAVTLGTLGRLESALSQLAAAGLLATPEGRAPELYLTEYGYFANGRRRIPEHRRARFLRQSLELAQRNPHVHQLLQYMLVSPGPFAPAFNTSVVCADGTPTGSFRAMSRWAKLAIQGGRIARPGPLGRLPRRRRAPPLARLPLPAAYPAPPPGAGGC